MFDHVADERAADAGARFRQKLVTVMSMLEWAFLREIGEVMIPFELGDAGDRLRAFGEEAKRSHETVLFHASELLPDAGVFHRKMQRGARSASEILANK